MTEPLRGVCLLLWRAGSRAGGLPVRRVTAGVVLVTESPLQRIAATVRSLRPGRRISIDHLVHNYPRNRVARLVRGLGSSKASCSPALERLPDQGPTMSMSAVNGPVLYALIKAVNRVVSPCGSKPTTMSLPSAGIEVPAANV